jgi:hypothetical protein
MNEFRWTSFRKNVRTLLTVADEGEKPLSVDEMKELMATKRRNAAKKQNWSAAELAATLADDDLEIDEVARRLGLLSKKSSATGKLDFQPLRIHKDLVIEALKRRPEDVRLVFADGRFANASEAIAALEAHPSEWIVDGVLGGPPQSGEQPQSETSRRCPTCKTRTMHRRDRALLTCSQCGRVVTDEKGVSE